MVVILDKDRSAVELFRLERRRVAVRKWQAKNTALYGITLPPKLRDTYRLRERETRIKNKETFGTTRTPEQRLKHSAYQKRHKEEYRANHPSPLIDTCDPYGKLVSRICKSCRADKPIDQFRLFGGKYYSHMCKPCCAPLKRGEEQQRRVVQSAKNKRLFGFVKNPEQREKDIKYYELRTLVNKERYGTATARERLDKLHRAYTDLRAKNIQLYGGQCVCCGECRTNRLVFDHIGGCGRANREPSNKLLNKVSKTPYPNNQYRLLCFNCNAALGSFGYCPHNGRPNTDLAPLVPNSAAYQRLEKRRLRLEFINAYGGKCCSCGESTWEFLALDHINNDGQQHRRSLGINGGVTLYRWLRRNGWPKDNYQLLCTSCNYVKELVRRQ